MSLFAEQFPVVFQALNEGFLQTLKLFFITLAGAIPLGLVICLGSMSRFRPLRYLVRLVIWVVRGTPLMLQLLIIYFFPGLVLKNNIWGQGELGRFAASCAAFVFNYACYFSEIYRGGIQSIPRGQTEAGQVLGMTNSQIFFKVKLLQMLKRIVPPMSNEVITLVKDTSLSHHRAAGGHLGRAGLHEGQSRHSRRHLAAVFHRRLLSSVQRPADAGAGLARAEARLFQSVGRARYADP